MVLQSSICTFALPWWQRSDWGLRVTQDAYFSLLSHTKQLLLVTFSDTTAEIGASFRTDACTDGVRTGRHGSRNSYLDLCSFSNISPQNFDILLQGNTD